MMASRSACGAMSMFDRLRRFIPQQKKMMVVKAAIITTTTRCCTTTTTTTDSPPPGGDEFSNAWKQYQQQQHRSDRGEEMRRINPSSHLLRAAVILGSTRDANKPPTPSPLGERVGKWVQMALSQRLSPAGPCSSEIAPGDRVKFGDPTHQDSYDLHWPPFEVDVLDPLYYREQIPLLRRPAFSYDSLEDMPEWLRDVTERLRKSDCIVCVTPEYNHGPSPSLVNFINHVSASSFAFKPSAIISYSTTHFGGVRAAQALVPILSEMGCLPVSAKVHLPRADKLLTESGFVVDEKGDGKSERAALRYIGRTAYQLWWWAEGARRMRGSPRGDPHVGSPPMRELSRGEHDFFF